jgi:hypothetical protein
MSGKMSLQDEIRERDRAGAAYIASLTTAALATLTELLRYRDWSLPGPYRINGGDPGQRVDLWRAIGRELERRAPGTYGQDTPERVLKTRWKSLSVVYPDAQIKPRSWLECAPPNLTVPEAAPVQKLNTTQPAPAVEEPRYKTRKAQYDKLQGVWHVRVPQMAARIVDYILMVGDTELDPEGNPAMRRRKLEKDLHSGAHPREWKEALEQYLPKVGGIKITPQKRRGSLVVVIDPRISERLCDPFDVLGYKQAKLDRQRKRDKRRTQKARLGRPRRSAWFEKLMADREIEYQQELALYGED